MAKKISFGLSPHEINDAIIELKQYKESLNSKCESFTRRLTDVGLNIAYFIIEKHVFSGDTIGSLRIETDFTGAITQMRVVVESEAILFLEFGSGIRHAGTVNPKAGEFGYGPGTYPGAGHWDDPNGWYFPTEDPRLIVRTDSSGQGWGHSYGIEAAMPMYQATIAMRQQIVNIAKDVFGS